MLELINEKRSEYMQAESLYLDHTDGYAEEVQPYPSHAPAPAPPALSKFQVCPTKGYKISLIKDIFVLIIGNNQ